MIKNETTKMTKLTSAQAYAAQVKADRRAAAAERRDGAIAADNARVAQLYPVAPKAAPKAPKSGKRVRWTGDELDLLVNLYLTHVDPINAPEEAGPISAEFSRQFPKRSGAAIVLGIAQIKAQDTYHPAKGMTDTSRALVDKLYAADPVRFPGGATREEKVMGALDLLLAEVLAA